MSEAPEPGLSSRVYLDPEMTMIGLAMARSIGDIWVHFYLPDLLSRSSLRAGDYAVKAVGVIPEPEVKELELEPNHKFMILASDGVWEFISSQVSTLSTSGVTKTSMTTIFVMISIIVHACSSPGSCRHCEK